jgi:sugar phosphate isomerase/epimerase
LSAYPSRNDLTLWNAAYPRTGFREFVTAAAGSGHGAISLNPRLYRRATTREGLTDAEMQGILAEHDVRVAVIEHVREWLPGREVPPPPENQLQATPDIFRLATTFGARTVSCIEPGGDPIALDRVVEAFAVLCRGATRAGLDVAIEFIPFSGIRDIATAWSVVETAGEPNSGLIFDTWHHSRSTRDDATLRRIPGDRILGVQLVDVPEAMPADIREECFTARLIPGEGELDLAGQLRILEANGCRAPIGVESWNAEIDRLDTLTVAGRCRAAVESLFSAARRRAGE